MDKSTPLVDVMLEETATLYSSFAVNQSLKEKGLMQVTTKLTEALFDTSAEEALAKLTQGKQAGEFPHPAKDIVASSDFADISPEQLEVVKDAKTKLGLGDDVSLEEMVEATKTPIKPLTKKQAKAQKRMIKNMQGQMRSYQRQGQATHIMNKLFACSIRTPEQARQIHANKLARDELTALLGVRQADAFFGAKADTKCHDFFPKATVDANPKLMTDLQGQSRTLSEVFEYFIYKHFMILTQKAAAKIEQPLNTTVDWEAVGEVPKYIPYAEGDKLSDLAQGDVVPAKEFAVGEEVTLSKEQVAQFASNIELQHALEGRDVPAATTKYLEDLTEKAA